MEIQEIPMRLKEMQKEIDELKRKKDPDQWIDMKTAMKQLCMKSFPTFYKFVERKELRNMNPCGHPRYLQSEVEKIKVKGVH